MLVKNPIKYKNWICCAAMGTMCSILMGHQQIIPRHLPHTISILELVELNSIESKFGFLETQTHSLAHSNFSYPLIFTNPKYKITGSDDLRQFLVRSGKYHRFAKHSSTDHSRLSGINFIFLLVWTDSSSHHPTRLRHLLHRVQIIILYLSSKSLIYPSLSFIA
jgi:hypothetical protein